MNVGRYQIIFWPRLVLTFYRHRPVRGIYSWAFYLWPIEVRCFSQVYGKDH
jgi:hypothetical protein